MSVVRNALLVCARLARSSGVKSSRICAFPSMKTRQSLLSLVHTSKIMSSGSVGKTPARIVTLGRSAINPRARFLGGLLVDPLTSSSEKRTSFMRDERGIDLQHTFPAGIIVMVATATTRKHALYCERELRLHIHRRILQYEPRDEDA